MSLRKRKVELIDETAVVYMDEFADIYYDTGFSKKEGYPPMKKLAFVYGDGICQVACFQKGKHDEFINYVKKLNKYNIQVVGQDDIVGLDKSYPKGRYVINIKYPFENK
jgi:hypothetical protein